MHTSHSTRSILACAAALALAGCGSVSDEIGERVTEEVVERAAESGSQDDVELDVDTDDGSLTIETDEGTFTSGGGELPEEFPDSMPVPDGVAVTGSMTGSGDSGEGFFVQLGAEESDPAIYEDLVAFYEAELEANGWTVDDRQTLDGAALRSTLFAVSDGSLEGTVQISFIGEEGDGVVGVQIGVEPAV